MEVGADHAGLMLADFLRKQQGLTGTKIVCAEGDCGACSVLKRAPGEEYYTPFNSCIMPVALVDGWSLVTVEGLAAQDGALSPEQKAMRECHGSQCGFCTPGFVVTLAGLTEKRRACGQSEPITPESAKNALTGNLCRCTGYEPILKAAVSMTAAVEPLAKRYSSSAQEAEIKRALKQDVVMDSDSFRFAAPRTLRAASDILSGGARSKDGGVRLISSGTDLGVVHNKRKLRLNSLLSLHLVPGLEKIDVTKERVRVGARASLTHVRTAMKNSDPEFARFLDLFASPQIKNVATLVGNVANASPIGDTPPFLLSMDAQVVAQGPRVQRKIPIAEFFLDYRKTALKKGELIVAIEWKPRGAGDFLRLYKVSQRKDLDISAVSCAFRVVWGKEGVVKDARIALGGVAATPLRFLKVEAALRGQVWNDELRVAASQVLQNEMKPLADLRGTAAFRRVLVENLFRRFFREAAAARDGLSSAGEVMKASTSARGGQGPARTRKKPGRRK